MVSAKEIWEQERQYTEMERPDHSRMQAYFDGSCHCSKCRTNWVSLSEQETDGDEAYSFCPICRTDEFIGELISGPIYRFDAITGQIIDTMTGHERLPAFAEPPPVKPYVPFDAAKYFADKAKREADQDRQIEEYLKRF